MQDRPADARTTATTIASGRCSRGAHGRSLSPLFASLATASWLVLADNIAFWKTFSGAQTEVSGQVIVTAAGLALVLISSCAALLRLVAGGATGVVVLSVLLIVSAGVSHYLDSWGVLFDKNLVRNIIESDVREARELLAWPAFLDLTLRGVLPAGVLWFFGIRSSRPAQTVLQTTALLATAAILAGVLLAAFYGTLATTFRNHRELRFQLVPTNYFNALYGHLKGGTKAPAMLARVAPDARRASTGTGKPLVLILIVGETARAANFSLGGYPRDTNGALAGAKAVYFGNVSSCGTDTATSIPCMFSDLGADAFGVSKAQERENVLDVLQRTGVEIEWLDNNSGCKGVCARVPTQQMPTSGVGEICSEGACLDEVLVPALEKRLSAVKGDTAIVLHQMGSHGPSYYRRYPAPGPFQPTCETNRIQNCDVGALVNTYDNSIDYTSKTIARAIEVARSQASGMDVAVVYLSDHGESLGERNIYLHGLPRLLAPSEQIRVPMLVWQSQDTQRRLDVPQACLASVSGRSYSHDNLFHSMLGFFGVSAAAYRPELDIWAIGRSESACERKDLTFKLLQGFQFTQSPDASHPAPDKEST